MDRIENLVEAAKISELLHRKKNDKVSIWVWVLAAVGVAVVAAGIVYAVYRYFKPDYLDDFEDEFEDDFEDEEDDFFEDEGER